MNYELFKKKSIKSELGFVGFKDDRIKKINVLILLSYNPTNPNSGS